MRDGPARGVDHPGTGVAAELHDRAVAAGTGGRGGEPARLVDIRVGEDRIYGVGAVAVLVLDIGYRPFLVAAAGVVPEQPLARRIDEDQCRAGDQYVARVREAPLPTLVTRGIDADDRVRQVAADPGHADQQRVR